MIEGTLDLLNSESKILQNLVSIFTILGVVIALVTVIVTIINLRAVVRQLKEMQLQRTHSQEPDLFIEPIDLFVNFQNEDILFHAPWSNKDGDKFSKVNPLPIRLTNIGNGVAKYISLKIYFEKDYLNELIELDKNKIFNLRTLLTDYGIEFFQYEYGEENKKQMRNHDVDEKEKHSFNYIRPEQSVSFLLNESFKEIFNIAMIINYVGIDSNSIPRMKVSVSYYDSFDNRYEKDIDIFIRRYNINSSTLKRNYDFSVSFELNALNRIPEKYINLD